MTAIQLTLMTVDEARSCVNQIKENLESTRALLFALHEREGWRALGYATWQQCITEEFHYSRHYAHRLLNAHMVDRILALRDPALPVGNAVEMPERHARELEPLLADEDAVREVVAEVQHATGGTPTAAAYREAVGRRLGDAPAPFEMPEQEQESEEERAYYALTRQRLVVRLDPGQVAEAATVPDAALPGFEEFERWLSEFMRVLRLRTGLRTVK